MECFAQSCSETALGFGACVTVFLEAFRFSQRKTAMAKTANRANFFTAFSGATREPGSDLSANNFRLSDYFPRVRFLNSEFD
jgi:hypothetical protein